MHQVANTSVAKSDLVTPNVERKLAPMHEDATRKTGPVEFQLYSGPCSSFSCLGPFKHVCDDDDDDGDDDVIQSTLVRIYMCVCVF